MTTKRKARNGEGSITTRTLTDGGKVYDVSVRFVDPITGERKRALKRGFTTQDEAVAYKNRVTTQAQSGALVRESRDTLEEYLTTWLKGRSDLKEQTWAGYDKKLRLHVIPHLGNSRLCNIRATDLNALYARLLTEGSNKGRGPLGKRSVREIHTILSSALKAAVTDGLLSSNPCSRAKPPMPKETKAPEFTVWSPEDVRAFLKAEDAKGSPYAALWLFLVSTGVRRGEALGLRWQDVDLEAGTATIRHTVGAIAGRIVRSAETKTGKARFIDLDPATVAALKAHKVTQAADRLSLGSRWVDEGLVFARGSNKLPEDHTAGGPLHPERLSRQFKDSCRQAGVTDIRLHDLRHTWATLALKAGIHPKVVQERLGHATIAVTLNIYSHVLPGMQRDAAEKVAALWA